MWVLLSDGLRRWIIFSIAVPVAARLLGSAGRRLEATEGRSRLSTGLQGAGRLVSQRAQPTTKTPGRTPHRGLLRRKR